MLLSESGRFRVGTIHLRAIGRVTIEFLLAVNRDSSQQGHLKSIPKNILPLHRSFYVDYMLSC